MDEDPLDKPQRHFYDVEWFRRVNSESVKKRGRLGRLLVRFVWAFDSVQGLFIVMLGPLILFGTLGIAVAGFYFGPLAFLGIFAGTVGAVALFADRKVGKSVQFDDSGFLKDLFGQILAFGLCMGLFLFLIFILPRVLAFQLF